MAGMGWKALLQLWVLVIAWCELQMCLTAEGMVMGYLFSKLVNRQFNYIILSPDQPNIYLIF
jgi:hypothetical protein